MSKRYDYIPSLDFDNIKYDVSNSNQYSRESQNPLANHLFHEEENRSKKVWTVLNTISFVTTHDFYVSASKLFL